MPRRVTRHSQLDGVKVLVVVGLVSDVACLAGRFKRLKDAPASAASEPAFEVDP